jgi:uncharacterized protein (TIGR03437 family)
MGSNLAGQLVSVTLDGIPAALIYTSDKQINFQVPAGLGSKTSAQLVATVDGKASAPYTVALSPAWPSVFAGGILNQDYSPNGDQAPASAGSVLQIFGTGIPADAAVSVAIGGHDGLIPMYAGAAPTVPGVQQVNVAVPEGVSGDANLVICVSTGGKDFCSTGYVVAVR